MYITKFLFSSPLLPKHTEEDAKKKKKEYTQNAQKEKVITTII